jgi:hypothetical protein
MKPSFFMKWNECGVYFSSMHPMKELVYRIYSCFMICIIALLSYVNANTAIFGDAAGKPVDHES